MKNKGIEYITIKRENMIRSNDEKEYYKFLSKLRRIIETIFSQIENLGLRFIRAISRRGLAIKIILSIIAFNILQMMKRFDENYG
jgi:DNA-binding LacI/PurR family transcriptional regulator